MEEAEGRRPLGLGGGSGDSCCPPSREGCVGVTRPAREGWAEEEGRGWSPRRGREGLEAGEASEAAGEEASELAAPPWGSGGDEWSSSMPLPLPPLPWGWYWSGWSIVVDGCGGGSINQLITPDGWRRRTPHSASCPVRA